MPSKRVTSIIIVCTALVFSIWLIKKPSTTQIKKVGTESIDKNDIVSVSPYEKITGGTNDSWKKILVQVDEKNTKYTNLIKESDNESFDDTTLTGQLSMEMLSRYLSVKGAGNKELSQEELGKIINDISELPQFSQKNVAFYGKSNIKIIPDSKESHKKYRDDINKILKDRSTKITVNPLDVFFEFIHFNNDKALVKLDPIIQQNKGIISDFLSVNVPERAVVMHIYMLNSMSKVLADIESMRTADIDPVKITIYMNSYSGNIKHFYSNLQSLNYLLDSFAKE